MTTLEHLLTCLAEEASELAQAATKALRFGMEDKWPGREETNQQNISKEFAEVFALMDMIREADPNENNWAYGLYDPKEILAKKERVWKWMGYARLHGTLTDPDLMKGKE